MTIASIVRRFVLLTALATSASAQLLKPNAPAPAAPALSASEQTLKGIKDVGVLMEKYEAARTANDLNKQAEVLRRLIELRPYAGGMQWELARIYALQDNKSGAYDAMLKLQAQGFAYDPTGDKDFDKVATTEVFKYTVEGLRANARAFGEGKVAFTVQHDAEQIETMVFDSKRSRFLAGSASTGEILAVNPSTGASTVFIRPDVTNKLYGVHALALDEARGILYAASTAVPSYKKFEQSQMGQGGIYAFDVATGKLIKRYSTPSDGRMHIIAAMTVAKSGEVYASDVGTNTVLQIRGETLKALFTSAEMPSLRGLAVSDDHKMLYISDYETGLYVASLEKNQIRALTVPKQNLGGIDGLYFYQGALYALQNGTYPARVIRVNLGAQPSVQPLEANKPGLINPSFGALRGDMLYFVSNSQRDLYDVNGVIQPGVKPERRSIYQVSTQFAKKALSNLAPVRR
jgi:sugar lactone lactonase YvrE